VAEADLLRAFCAATARGYAEAAAAPEAAAWILAAARAGVDPGAAAGRDLPLEVLTEAVSACATTWQIDDWGRHDHEALATFARWMAGEGLLSWSAGHGAEFRDEYLPERATTGTEPA
jgi:hypothetical protein